LADIGNAVEKNVPTFVVQANIYKYLSSLFYNTGDAGTVFDILMEADRLLVVPSDEIALKQTRGLVANWEVILHDSGVTLIKELMRENPNYLELDLNEQISLLIAKAQDKADSIKGVGALTADGISDNLGKIPLAIQQISLAIDRMKQNGDNASVALLTKKLKTLTGEI
jgi:hypothetical protein